MKLKDNFITQDINDKQMMIDITNNFNGIIKSNETAAFIINELKSNTTIDNIVSKMLEIYDASEEEIRKDVESIISKLKNIGAID